MNTLARMLPNLLPTYASAAVIAATNPGVPRPILRMGLVPQSICRINPDGTPDQGGTTGRFADFYRDTVARSVASLPQEERMDPRHLMSFLWVSVMHPEGHLEDPPEGMEIHVGVFSLCEEADTHDHGRQVHLRTAGGLDVEVPAIFARLLIQVHTESATCRITAKTSEAGRPETSLVLSGQNISILTGLWEPADWLAVGEQTPGAERFLVFTPWRDAFPRQQDQTWVNAVLDETIASVVTTPGEA